MVNHLADALDPVFGALGDPRRRAVVATLSRGTRSVSELAREHEISLPGFMKHLRVLEGAGLIVRVKHGRVVRCTLAVAPMERALAWLEGCKAFWSGTLDSLGRYLAQHEKEAPPWPASGNPIDRRSRSPSPTPRRRERSGARGPIRRR